jgi:hypothetical protein
MSDPTGDDVPASAMPGPAPEPQASSGPPPIAPGSPQPHGAPEPYGSLAQAPFETPSHIEPELPGERARSVRAGALAAVLVAVAGLGIGLLWLGLAPRLGIIKIAEGFIYADKDPEEAIAADAVFGFLGLGAGVVVAVLGWVLLRRYRGVAVLTGLVVGSLIGAWLAWWLGVRLGMAQFEAARDSAPIGGRIEAPLGLRVTNLDRNAYWPPQVTGVVAVQALGAAITYTMLAGFSIYPGLRPPRRRRDSAEQVSWDRAGPADPPG